MTTPGPTAGNSLMSACVEQLDTSHPGAARLAVLVELRRLVEYEVAAEVQTMTHRHGSWADVGRILGMSKQAAWERYRTPPSTAR